VATDHRAACHFAEEALQSDIGVAHMATDRVRHGTPQSATEGLAAEHAATAATGAAGAATDLSGTGSPNEPSAEG
jgi:hypothetical protein